MRRRQGIVGLSDMLFDTEWTEWLPIYSWLIEHDEGLLLIDTGETARVHANLAQERPVIYLPRIAYVNSSL